LLAHESIVSWLATNGHARIDSKMKRKSKVGPMQIPIRTMTDKIVVLVTCGTAKEARRIAHALVERRLAACANLFSVPIHSIYRWKGKVESAKEFQLTIKTSRKRFRAVAAEVKRLHSYDVPEIIALPISAGSGRYLDWISESVSEVGAGKRKRR
jgi:periplasmic divalent cation tolerance protein